MKSPLRLAVVTTCAMLAVACASSPPPPASSVESKSAGASLEGVEQVDGARAQDLVKGGARLVDVRTPDEYAEKHIDGAINIPLDRFDEPNQDMGAKDAPIIVYCQKGGRARRAAESLHAKGFTKVYLLGAITNWNTPPAAPASTTVK